jgi:hypothetical protein
MTAKPPLPPFDPESARINGGRWGAAPTIIRR